MTLTQAFAAAPERPRSGFRFATGRAADGTLYLAIARSGDIQVARMPAGTAVEPAPAGVDWDPVPGTAGG